MLGSVLLGHLPAVLGLWAGTTLRLSFLPKGLDIGITGYLPLGLLSGWAFILPWSLETTTKKNSPCWPSQSLGVLEATMEAWERPWFPAFLEGSLRFSHSVPSVGTLGQVFILVTGNFKHQTFCIYLTWAVLWLGGLTRNLGLEFCYLHFIVRC